tara:strand:- start:31 stop:780 length:750 start_codon:yes stop_codon:yes gene_type:complete
MTEQIQTHPTDFTVDKHFGPFFASCILPQDAIDAMLKMSDEILSDKLSESHGESLAGVIEKEIKVYKSNMEKAGVDQLIESCLKSYVVHCAKHHNFFNETYIIESYINSAWIVSQYENEYNPTHNHTGCDISAVIYLKTPDVKGRRNIESKKGKTDFDGDISFLHSSVGHRNFDIFEKGIINITPVPGLLVMFPSYLMHTVYPFIGEGERRCLPFNAVYRIFDENKSFIAGNLSGVQNPTFYMEKKPNE